MHAKDRHNTTSMEWGLTEDLIAHTLCDLKSMPLKTGLVSPHSAPQKMVKALRASLGDWVDHADITTAIEARHGPIKIRRGDWVLYRAANQSLCAGDVWFLASAHEFGGDVAFIGNYRRLENAASSEFWRFEEIVGAPMQVPLDLVYEVCVWNQSNGIVTVLCPYVFR